MTVLPAVTAGGRPGPVNVLAAEAAGVPVQEFVDANAAAFTGLAVPLSLSTDDLVRTSSDPRGRRAG